MVATNFYKPFLSDTMHFAQFLWADMSKLNGYRIQILSRHNYAKLMLANENVQALNTVFSYDKNNHEQQTREFITAVLLPENIILINEYAN